MQYIRYNRNIFFSVRFKYKQREKGRAEGIMAGTTFRAVHDKRGVRRKLGSLCTRGGGDAAVGAALSPRLTRVSCAY